MRSLSPLQRIKTNKQKVVAVTDASGFIGAHIVQVCLERGYDVSASVRDRLDKKNIVLSYIATRTGAGKEFARNWVI